MVLFEIWSVGEKPFSDLSNPIVSRLSLPHVFRYTVWYTIVLLKYTVAKCSITKDWYTVKCSVVKFY